MFDEYKTTRPAILIKNFLDHFTEGVFEVRIPKTKYGTISGYFNDTAIAAALIAKENAKHPGIYVTANPVDSALLARNENKFEYGCHTTSTDSEITRRRWFLVDLDPIRPAGISSTDQELNSAVALADSIEEWLTSLGWPAPLRAMSGNGAHLMYRVDEPNDEPTRIEFENATKMLAAIYTTDQVAVDVTIWNASRIWKIGGTVSAKGSNTDQRPHRVAQLTKIPKDIQPVPRGLIEVLAGAMKNAKTDEYKDMTGEYIIDMEKWLFDRGQTVTSGPRPLYGTEGKKWVISRCPFNPNHSGPIVGLVNNRPIYRCLHHSCSAFRWKEFREKIDPTFQDPEVIYARLKAWCDGDSNTSDEELFETACRTGKKLDGLIGRLKKECVRARVLLLEDFLKIKRRQFIKDTIGENNEKGNIVGLINRTRSMQEEGIVPMYWIADYDHRVRVGQAGDLMSEKSGFEHEIALMVKFHSLGDSWVKQTHCSQIIMHLAQEYRVNPLKLHYKKYRWDGVKRIDTWLPHYLGTKDGVYTRAIGRKWLISVAARAIDPGCQADHMLILEGAQGIGKSRALRVLGGQFYTEHSKSMTGGPNGQRDLVHVILGKSIVEMSELATIKRADIESLKAMLTTTVDDVRLSYERDAKSYPRTCVFAGTTNEIGQAYIADVSGARRFWPTIAGESGPVRVDALAEDREQLWAEAVEAYENGEDWWTVPLEETAHEQGDRQITIEVADPWYLKVRQALTTPESYSNEAFICQHEYERGQPTGGFTVRAGSLHVVLGLVVGLDIERQGSFDANRLKNIYRAIGFKKIRPQNGWFDSSYAYELKKDAAPHLWMAIQQAALAGRPSLAEEMAKK
jgi:hypothetical protein